MGTRPLTSRPTLPPVVYVCPCNYPAHGRSRASGNGPGPVASATHPGKGDVSSTLRLHPSKATAATNRSSLTAR
jgi:hypothetical protein